MKDTKQFLLRDKIAPYLSGEGQDRDIQVPEHLASWIEIAVDLHEDREAGGVFLPDSLSAGGWACIKGITEGIKRAEVARQNEPET